MLTKILVVYSTVLTTLLAAFTLERFSQLSSGLMPRGKATTETAELTETIRPIRRPGPAEQADSSTESARTRQRQNGDALTCSHRLRSMTALRAARRIVSANSVRSVVRPSCLAEHR